MAAGLGFKDFQTGEVLTAADVDGYLMQGVWVFASAAARDAAVTSPQEGNFAYLKDTNVTTYYTGSAWANLDTTGMTNPMTTTGDTIYSSSGSTPARLGIGTAGQVLRVNSGATAPEWATAASGGGMTLLSTTTLSSSSTTITTDFTGYLQAYISFENVDLSANDGFLIRPNNSSTGVFMALAYQVGSAATLTFENNQEIQFNFGDNLGAAQTVNNALLQINNPASTSTWKSFNYTTVWEGSGGSKNSYFGGGGIATTSAITSIVCVVNTGGTTFQAGTVKVYGVK